MLPADLILFPVPFYHNAPLLVFSPVQLDGKNRNIDLCPWLSLIYHKIKSPCIKQIAIASAIPEYVGDTHFLLTDTPVVCFQYIVQRLIQIL